MYHCWAIHRHGLPSPITQTHYAAGVLSTLKQFGIEDLATALQAVDGAHEIWNLLSLEHNLHSKFDSLDLWFEGTDKVCHSETFRLS